MATITLIALSRGENAFLRVGFRSCGDDDGHVLSGHRKIVMWEKRLKGWASAMQ